MQDEASNQESVVNISVWLLTPDYWLLGLRGIHVIEKPYAD